jgi:peroxiredoxin
MPSLTEQLKQYKNSFQKSVSSEVLEILSRNVSLLQKQQIKVNKLSVGDVMKGGQLYDHHGSVVEFDNLLLEAPLIITFIRGAWCPYCMIELQEWHKFIGTVETPINFVAVSAELSTFSEQAKEDNKLGFTIWEDKNYQLAKKFGLTYEVGPEMKALLLKWGINLTTRTCIDDFVLPIPATYIIDKNHTVCYAFLEVDYTERAEPKNVYQEYKKLL